MIADLAKGQHWKMTGSPYEGGNGTIIIVNEIKKRKGIIIAERIYRPFTGAVSKRNREWMHIRIDALEKEWTRIK